MDALVRAFASDDDGVIVAADEADVVNGGEDGANDGDGDASDNDRAPVMPLEATKRML